MLTKSKSLVALDIGTHSIKTLSVTAEDSALIVTDCALAEITSELERNEILTRVIEDHKLRGEPVVTAVSGRNVIIRYIIMQQMPQEELDNAIQYELDKHIPFSAAEVVTSCQKLEDIDSSSNEMKVLLVAVKRNVVNEHVRLLQEMGLRPAAIDVDPFAIGNAFELNYGTESLEPDSVVALVDIGATKTDINIIYNGLSRFSRELYVAGSDISESIARRLSVDPYEVDALKADPGARRDELLDAIAPTLDALANEVSLSFDFFETEYDRPVTQIYLSGGSSLLDGICGVLSSLFGKPVENWDPLRKVKVNAVGTAGELLRRNAAKFAVAVGLGARIWG